MTHPISLLLAAAGLAVFAASLAGAQDCVLYNPSPSIPSGFYTRIDAAPMRGAIVTVRARDVASAYARLRDFDDDSDRFIKRVAVTAGGHICADGDHVTIDDRMVMRAERDSDGRTLPRWTGCHTLGARELFLLGDTDDSFDSRYWGPIDASVIEGVWRPL